MIPGLALSLESSFFGFYAHAGFAAALMEKGIRPSFLTGASAGSLLAVLLAAGFTTEEIRNIIFSPRFKWGFWEAKSFARGMAMSFHLPAVSGLSSGRHAVKHLAEVLREKAPRLEDTKHGEVSVAVANLNTLRTQILTHGDSAGAIVASCAVPLLIAPQKIAGHHLSDGGLANSSPFLHYAEDPRVDTIITHHIRHTGRLDAWEKPGFRPRISDTLSRGHLLITEEIHRLHLEKMRTAGKKMLPVTTVTDRPGLFSGKKLQEKCYELGRKSGEVFRERWMRTGQD